MVGARKEAPWVKEGCRGMALPLQMSLKLKACSCRRYVHVVWPWFNGWSSSGSSFCWKSANFLTQSRKLSTFPLMNCTLKYYIEIEKQHIRHSFYSIFRLNLRDKKSTARSFTTFRTSFLSNLCFFWQDSMSLCNIAHVVIISAGVRTGPRILLKTTLEWYPFFHSINYLVFFSIRYDILASEKTFFF